MILAVGGYSGISSSSIAVQPDGCIVDDRLNAAECLAMTHRPDVMRTIRRRYASSPHNTENVEYDLRRYNALEKPSAARELSCLAGATLIDLADSFTVNQRMFGRDAAGAETASYDLSLVFAHPKSSCGCMPVDMKRFYKLNEEEDVVGLLLELIVHCPPVHDVLMTAFEGNKSEYLRKLLHFVKRCSGQAGFKTGGGFKNASDCLRQTKDECQRLNMPYEARHKLHCILGFIEANSAAEHRQQLQVTILCGLS